MRRLLNRRISGFLTILWLFSQMWFVGNLSAAAYGSTRTHKNAELEKKADNILTFVVDVKGRMRIVKGLLSDRTRIRDKQNNPIPEQALEPGSVWRIKLDYPRDREGLPAIVDMVKIRGRAGD